MLMPWRKKALARFRPLTRSVAGETSGVTAIEFALVLPIFMSLGMFGAEVAYMSIINMQVSQLAASVADNASRLGQTDNSAVSPTVSEIDVDTVMAGALSQGESIDLDERGRVILTSLEVHPVTGRQWIHWQRCTGSLARASLYGNDSTSNGVNGPVIVGLGQNEQITAQAGSAVMFVEVFYQYEGLFGSMFISPKVMHQEAAFLVRDGRNLLPNSAKGLSGTQINSPCTS